MGTLFISFAVAIGGAVGLVFMSRTFDLETYTTRVFPLIPILYAIIYETLEKRKTGKTRSIPPSKAMEEMKAGAVAIFQNITVGRIAGDVGISFLIKFSLEVLLTFVTLAINHQSFGEVYGTFTIETLGRLLRGDHPWLSGGSSLILLALIALIASLGTGLWIGTTTKASPILEGVLAGAAVTVITSMTNLLVLYRTIEELTTRAADSLGYVTHFGFAAVISLQVLLYGVWSGIAHRSRLKREARAAEKKSAKRSKK
jgi:hypothetical protein